MSTVANFISICLNSVGIVKKQVQCVLEIRTNMSNVCYFLLIVAFYTSASQKYCSFEKWSKVAQKCSSYFAHQVSV